MSKAFNKCPELKSIYYDTDNPLPCYQDVFNNSTYSLATLYIRESALDKIKNTVPWKLFLKVEPYNFSGIEYISSDKIDYPIEVFNLDGIKISDNTNNLPDGLYIVRQGKEYKKFLVK